MMGGNNPFRQIPGQQWGGAGIQYPGGQQWGQPQNPWGQGPQGPPQQAWPPQQGGYPPQQGRCPPQQDGSAHLANGIMSSKGVVEKVGHLYPTW